MTGDTYPMPEHGWTCFHCGETFTNYGEAYMHFGPTPDSRPACSLDRGILIDLRAAEDSLQELHLALEAALAVAAKAHRRMTVRNEEDE